MRGVLNGLNVRCELLDDLRAEKNQCNITNGYNIWFISLSSLPAYKLIKSIKAQNIHNFTNSNCCRVKYCVEGSNTT